MIAVSRFCHSGDMPANDDFFTLITGAALALVGFGFAVSRTIRLVRFAGMLALAYGLYLILVVTRVIG